MKNLLRKADLKALAKLQDSRLDFITGFDVSDDLYSDLILISTSLGNLVVRSEVVIGVFEGFRNEYSNLRFNEAPVNTVDQVLNDGLRYLKQKNSVIKAAEIVRAKFEHFENGKSAWVYETDLAILLRTSVGFITIKKDSIHNEVLIVDYSSDEPSLAGLDVSNRFENDLFENTAVSVQRLDVFDLLAGA